MGKVHQKDKIAESLKKVCKKQRKWAVNCSQIEYFEQFLVKVTMSDTDTVAGTAVPALLQLTKMEERHLPISKLKNSKYCEVI